MRRESLLVVLLFTVVGIVLAYPHVCRRGFSPDEELTFFAAKGVSESAFPILPSGVLYDRGLPYTYIAWLAGALTGPQIIVYRWIALIFWLLTIVLEFVLAGQVSNFRTATLSALALVSTPIGILYSSWARFYTMFAAFYALTILLLFLQFHQPRYRSVYLLSLLITVLLNQLGALVLLLPILMLFTEHDQSFDQRAGRTVLIWSALTVAFAGLLLLAANDVLSRADLNWTRNYVRFYFVKSFVARPSLNLGFPPGYVWGASAVFILFWLVRTLRRGQVIRGVVISLYILFLAGNLPSLIVAAILFLVLIRPKEWGGLSITGAVFFAACVLAWPVALSLANRIEMNPGLFLSTFAYSCSYPLNGFITLWRLWPFFTAIFLACALCCAFIEKGSSKIVGLLLFALANLLILGIIRVSLESRHFLFLFPIFFVLVFHILNSLVIAPALRLSQVRRPLISVLLSCAVAAGIVVEQVHSIPKTAIFSTTSGRSFFPDAQLKSYQADLPATIPHTLPQKTIVISNDELGCMYLFHRLDYWLPASEQYYANFKIRRSGCEYGWYGGGFVLENAGRLRSVISAAIRSKSDVYVIVMNTTKFGHGTNRLAAQMNEMEHLHKQFDTPDLVIFKSR